MVSLILEIYKVHLKVIKITAPYIPLYFYYSYYVKRCQALIKGEMFG